MDDVISRLWKYVKNYVCGKMGVIEWVLVLVFCLISWEGGVKFLRLIIKYSKG